MTKSGQHGNITGEFLRGSLAPGWGCVFIFLISDKFDGYEVVLGNRFQGSRN